MFLHRLTSTIVLLTVFGGMIFAPNPYRNIIFYVFSVVLTGLLIREVTDTLKNMNVFTYERILPYLGVLIMLPNIFVILWSDYKIQLIASLLLFSIGTIITISMMLAAENSAEKIKKLFHSLMVLLLTAIPVLMIVWIYVYGETSSHKFNMVFLFFALMTKIGDIGAYVTGTLSNRLLKGGNHKLIPKVSPGKSWEGMFGGLIITVLFGMLLAYWLNGLFTIVGAGIMGVFFYFGGMVGDLAESSFKRAGNMKDSGHIFPGIGGVYDLVDSLFMGAPIFILMQLLLLFLNGIKA